MHLCLPAHLAPSPCLPACRPARPGRRSDLLDRVRRLKDEKYADMPVEQFIRDVLGFNEPEEQPPRPGALRLIVNWGWCGGSGGQQPQMQHGSPWHAADAGCCCCCCCIQRLARCNDDA